MRQFKGLLGSGCCHMIHTARTVTVCTAAHPAPLQCNTISVMSCHRLLSHTSIASTKFRIQQLSSRIFKKNFARCSPKRALYIC
jgi:hypothetical protein